ncbi:MAG: chlorite dismutase family protein [Polyangiaceae bacterium]
MGEDIPRVDVVERGGKGPDGEVLTLDRRLFVQLLVFDCAPETNPTGAMSAIATKLQERGVAAVVYADVNAPRGFGVLTYDEDPAVFVDRVRPAVNDLGALHVVPRPDFTMIGRSYAGGHETDLPFWLIDRPKSVIGERRVGAGPSIPAPAGRRVEPRRARTTRILREHAIIGRAYGAEDLAHDVRLACHGLDPHDNDFLIGLIGKDLHPLSHVVQSMRKTRQTREFITQMGPFFVGRVAARTREAQAKP